MIHIYVSVTFFFSRQEVSICILDALNTTLQKYNTLTVLKWDEIWKSAVILNTLWQLIITFPQITQLSDKCLRYPADSTNADGIRMSGRSEFRWQSEYARKLLPALRTG